ncbi:hypothetical protein DENSPDRAFT_759299, partial [Dentipellis sp. KUC8613]
SPSLPFSRKRTSSFSSPPLKTPRMALQRTASYLSVLDALPTPSLPSNTRMLESSRAPYTRTTQHYKEQRPRPKATVRTCASPMPAPPVPSSLAATPSSQPYRPRMTSPLAPTRQPLPARAMFPRSKHEPDLYRTAIAGRMRRTADGQKILHMGPRLAVSIITATRELERMVEDQHDVD